MSESSLIVRMNDKHPPRESYVGGSDIAAILGISPWSSPVDLWLQKRGEGPTRYDDPILRRGRRLEPYVRAMYAEDTGRVGQIAPPSFYEGPEAWIGGNLDGETDDRIVEVKTGHPRTAKAWGEPGTDSIPVYYTAQVQWYMLVRGKRFADVAALLGIDDFRIFTVEADPELQAKLVATARDFWRLVQIGVPPPITSEDDARALFPTSIEATLEATPDDVETYNELNATCEEITTLEGTAARLRQQLMARMASNEVLATSGRKLVTWKTQSARRVDVTALRLAHPQIAEAVTRVSESRVFRLK